MFRSRLAGALVLTLAVAAQPAAAQTGFEPAPTGVRQGFHFSLGVGGGAAGITCEGCDFDFADSINGFSGVLRLGGSVSDHLVIAIEGMGWIKNETPLERRIASAGVVALLYPSATSGFFLKGGLGFMRSVIEDPNGWLASNSMAPQAGLGFDIPMGQGVSLTPYVNAYLGTNSSTEALGYSLPIAMDPFVFQAGIALTAN